MVHNVWAIVLGTGKGEQLASGTDTAFLNLGTHPVITYSLTAFEKCKEIDGILVVVPKDRQDTVRGLVQMYGYTKVKELMPGTVSRSSAIQNALKVLNDRATVVVIHEISRPCITSDIITDTIKAAKKHGSGISATKIPGNLKTLEKGSKIPAGVVGSTVWSVETPQAYKTEVLQKALDAATKKKVNLVDETQAMDLIKEDIHLVPVQNRNIKLSSPEDLSIATALLR